MQRTRVSLRTARCVLCGAFVASTEPCCAGPCGATIHSKCAHKRLGVPLTEEGVAALPFRCSSCATMKSSVKRSAPSPPLLPMGVEGAASNAFAPGAPVGSASGPLLPSRSVVGDTLTADAKDDVVTAVRDCSAVVKVLADAQVSMQEALQNKIDGMQECLQGKMSDLQASYDCMSESLSSVSSRLRDLAVSNGELLRRCDELEMENGVLRVSLQDANERIHSLEREACAGDLITGVPETPDESLREIVRSVGVSLRVNIASSDILAADRIGKTAPNGARPRAVLVRLASGVLRDDIIRRKRNKGVLLARKVVVADADRIDGDAGRVNVNKGLPRSLRRVLAEAREFVTAKNWQRCWVRGGRIFILRDAKSRPVTMSSSQELQGLL